MKFCNICNIYRKIFFFPLYNKKLIIVIIYIKYYEIYIIIKIIYINNKNNFHLKNI